MKGHASAAICLPNGQRAAVSRAFSLRGACMRRWPTICVVILMSLRSIRLPRLAPRAAPAHRRQFAATRSRRHSVDVASELGRIPMNKMCATVAPKKAAETDLLQDRSIQAWASERRLPTGGSDRGVEAAS